MNHPIPDDARREAMAFIGRTGSGKSYAARGLAERVLHLSERFCVLDPTGVWWGLRLSANGKARGYQVVVFGGDHADVQIGEHSGKPLARLVAQKNVPCVIDTSGFTMGERVRFMTAFLDALYVENRLPLTIMFDEADLVAPQRALPDQTVMLSRMEQIVRRGRVRGFRPWLITQRPAELHKSVLSQAATLVALKLPAPQDRDAVGAWIEGQADRDEGKKILASLPSLDRGEGWVWCPGHKILKKVRFPRIDTYDSMRTPEEGEKAPVLAELSKADLSVIEESIKEVESEALANDPKALRRRIAELERQSGGIDQVALDKAYDAGYLTGVGSRDELLRQKFAGILNNALAALDGLVTAPASPPPRPADKTRIIIGSGDGEKMAKAERLILTALAQYPAGRTKNQVAILGGYAVTGGGFNNALGALKGRGWIDGRGDSLTISDAGRRALGAFMPLPIGAELAQHWMRQLSKAERAILGALIECYPMSLTKEDVAQKAGYEAKGGGFNNALGRLRTLELIDGRSDLRASEDLFG